jgi:hypothetical protein
MVGTVIVDFRRNVPEEDEQDEAGELFLKRISLVAIAVLL